MIVTDAAINPKSVPYWELIWILSAPKSKLRAMP